jgi:sec-independent protein translocase protein TatC
MAKDSPIAGFLERMESLEQGPLLGRLEELRSRIIRCMAIVFAVFVLCFTFAKPILIYLEGPLVQALPPGARVLHFMGPLEVFVAYVQVSFMIALCIALPVLLAQIWSFLKPALPDVDHGLVVPFFVASLLLFVGGVAFCFYVMMPVALKFLIEMGKDVAVPTIMVADYVSLTTFMLLGFGATFQLPLIIIILERLGVLGLDTLTGNRRYILVGIVTVAAIVTPTPDPFSQIALATPMYLMFEAAILVIKALRRREAKAQKA